MARVLNVPSEKFRDKMVSSLHEYMTTVARELGAGAPTRAEATRLLVEQFAEVLEEDVCQGALTDEEEARLSFYAHHLFDPAFVYRNEGYFQPGVKIRDGVRLLEGLYKAPGGLIRVVWREAEGTIDDVVIGGDFFVEPADALARLERQLKGVPAEREALQAAILAVWDTVDAPGVQASDVVEAFSQGKIMSPAALV